MTKIISVIALCCSFLFVNQVMCQTKRYVKPLATGTGDGSSWANASSGLQAMLDVSADNDEVWVAKGTYRPTLTVGYTAAHIAYTDDRHKSFFMHSGVKLYGGFAGTEYAVTQRKLSLNKTILTGDLLGNDAGFSNNGENVYHVITAVRSHNLRLDGITITGGNTTGLPATYLNDAPAYTALPADGAGVYASDCDYYITLCVFSNNYATRNGGAVCNAGGSGNGIREEGSITGSLFINNRAAQGSVLYASGPNNSFSFLINCTGSNNISTAATVAANGNRVSITNSILWYNTVVGPQIDVALIAADHSLIQGLSTSTRLSTDPPDPGPDPLDPSFGNRLDPDGADNIFGTADDGLIPLCGPAIGGGINISLPAKDLRDAARIQNGTIDIGAYETPLVQKITSLSITANFSAAADIEDSISENNLPAAGACEGSGPTFSTTMTGNGGVYQWKKNGSISGTNSPTYTPVDFHANDQITLSYLSAAGCAAANIVQSNTITLVNVSAGKPAIPFGVLGPVNPCPYINGAPVEYKINKAPGAVIYYWQFSVPGGRIISHPNGPGVNDTIVLVSFTAGFTTGKIIVTARNWCGWSTQKYLSITSKVPATPLSLAGPTDLCPFLPSVAHPNGLAVTYSTGKIADASSYLWVVPAGATIISHAGSGANDTAVNVMFNSSFVSGSISVQALNFCGSKSPRALSLSKKAAGTPGTITGAASVCSFKQSIANPAGIPVNYTIKKVLYATSYTWTLPAFATATHPGGTGANDTIITVMFSSNFAGGAITVNANTNCNSSAAKSLSILYTLPSTPGTITAGGASSCPQRRISYSLASMPFNASSVQWTVPAGASIVSGQGSLNMLVEFNRATIATDSIKVAGINECGISSPRKLKVASFSACRIIDSGNGQLPSTSRVKLPAPQNKVQANKFTNELNITAAPNPANGYFSLHISSNGINKINMLVTDAAGRLMEQRQSLDSNQTIYLGEKWKPGIYIATFMQGEKKKIMQLVKL